MPPYRRYVLAIAFLALGLGAQTSLESAVGLERLPLADRLSTIPNRLGDWEGSDVPMDPHVLQESGADDYLNREYIDPRDSRRRLMLWINYSTQGYNLCHSPEVCLPSGGFTKIDAREQQVGDLTVSRLGYAKGEVVQRIGFWYYVFGEGAVEKYLRSLPITSRSSHGRATRGSSLTVEVFCPDDADPDGEALASFIAALRPSLEGLLPTERAPYYLP
jgi:EpsI family protein